MHIGDLEEIQKKLEERFKNRPGINGIDISNSNVFIYVLNEKVKREVKMSLGEENELLIQVVVTGPILPAED
jgi:hypothetical protein